MDFKKNEEKLLIWENGGIRTLSNGTKLICHVPGPEACLHKIYVELSEEDILMMEKSLDYPLPSSLKDFYKRGVL